MEQRKGEGRAKKSYLCGQVLVLPLYIASFFGNLINLLSLVVAKKETLSMYIRTRQCGRTVGALLLFLFVFVFVFVFVLI